MQSESEGTPVISSLRAQLREMGIPDEDMFFDDTPDGKGIIPRKVLQMDEVFVLAQRPPLVLVAEKDDLSDNQDSPVLELGH